MMAGAKGLTPSYSYKAFVRAWYDANTFKRFASDCVTIAPFAPEASPETGKVTIHQSDDVSSPKALVLLNKEQVFVSWPDSFVDHNDLITAYEVGFGTRCGGQCNH